MTSSGSSGCFHGLRHRSVVRNDIRHAREPSYDLKAPISTAQINGPLDHTLVPATEVGYEARFLGLHSNHLFRQSVLRSEKPVLRGGISCRMTVM